MNQEYTDVKRSVPPPKHNVLFRQNSLVATAENIRDYFAASMKQKGLADMVYGAFACVHTTQTSPTPNARGDKQAPTTTTAVVDQTYTQMDRLLAYILCDYFQHANKIEERDYVQYINVFRAKFPGIQLEMDLVTDMLSHTLKVFTEARAPDQETETSEIRCSIHPILSQLFQFGQRQQEVQLELQKVPCRQTGLTDLWTRMVMVHYPNQFLAKCHQELIDTIVAFLHESPLPPLLTSSKTPSGRLGDEKKHVSSPPVPGPVVSLASSPIVDQKSPDHPATPVVVRTECPTDTDMSIASSVVADTPMSVDDSVSADQAQDSSDASLDNTNHDDTEMSIAVCVKENHF